MIDKKQILNSINKKLNTSLSHIKEINAGMNNKLYKIWDDQKSYLLKFYLKDDRQRLEREFRAFSFLHKKGFQDVPKGYFKDQQAYFGVYSFEDGISKKSSEITKADIYKMANFLVKLHSITPKQVNIAMPPAVNACFAPQGYINNINFRLNKFIEYSSLKNTPLNVRELNRKLNIEKLIKKMIKKATSNFTLNQLKTPIPKSKHRLNPLDFGIQNMIFRPDGTICFIDFEFFGFDDQMRLIADFVKHDQSIGLPKNYKELIIHLYCDLLKLNKKSRQRLDLVLDLTEIEWITIYLYSITPDKLRSRRFASINFNEEAYITEQIKKINLRTQEIII